MNCNCLSEVENTLADYYQAELGVRPTVVCQNAGFGIVGNKCVTIHLTHFKVTAPAKGFAKGKIMNVHASFCPICGKPAAKEPEYKGKATLTFPCDDMGREVEA